MEGTGTPDAERLFERAMIRLDRTRRGDRVRIDWSSFMTDASWDQYVAGAEVGSPESAAGAADGTSQDEALAEQTGNYISDAGSAADWAAWKADTGDEASRSAQSYFDAAATAATGGYADLAADEIADGNLELGAAGNTYGDAADYDSTAASYLQGAGQDLELASTDTGLDNSAAVESVTGASDDYSAASSDYADASYDATSLAADDTTAAT